MKIDAIFAYAKQNSRRNFADYCDRKIFRSDYRMIAKDKRQAERLFWYFTNRNITGVFNRLTITDDTINYCAGQYPPTEIWHAVHAMMQRIMSDDLRKPYGQ
jgi:hypothetical protein